MFKLPRKTLINFILTVVVVLCVSNFLSCIKNPVQSAFKPQLSFIGLIKREVLGLVFYHRNMLLAQSLQTDVERLRWRLFNLRELNHENIRLKNLFAFKQKSSLRFLVAQVIGRSMDSWNSTVLIDKGRYQGIKTGMVVVSPQGLIGSIVESADHTSKVLLINDPNQGIFSIVQRSRQKGLVSGTLGSNLIMRYLPDEAQIEIGDLIVTSGLSQVYPKGLLVGKVVTLGREFSGLNRYALIKPAADLSSIEEVMVIVS